MTKGDTDGSRCFRHVWLRDYSPWLAYSSYLRGPLCLFCVIFPQPVHRGIQGSFILRPFVKYKDFHTAAKAHMTSEWHRGAQANAEHFKSFKENRVTDPAGMICTNRERKIEQNRSKLKPILSTIILCGNREWALRGKTSTSGNVKSLYEYRIEGGDEVLRDHLQNSPKNALYTSNRIQNDLIFLCEAQLRRELLTDMTETVDDRSELSYFAVIADETADISGTEQLSIGVRYVDMTPEKPVIREQFFGFTPLEEVDAESIANTILDSCRNYGLDLNKLVGQGYDGCSTMAGKESGVQARIKQQYPKATFVHCASHRLNLVVNDLNKVPQIRNAVATIKATIRFFRESPKRRRQIPNIPLFCETRWTAKYKSIRVFSENFKMVFDSLEDLSTNSNPPTRTKANSLHAAVNATFLVCLVIMATYSARLEPVTQVLQSIDMDVSRVRSQITSLLTSFTEHRDNADERFKNDILPKVQELADYCGAPLQSRAHARSRQIAAIMM